MKVGIIGAGNVGATIARLLAEGGHQVILSNSRGPDSLRELVGRLGPNARAATGAEAAASGEVVVLAVPWDAVPKAVEAAGGSDVFRGKVVVDATNPYGFHGPPGERGETSSERVLRLVPGGRLVKTFNAMAAGRLSREGGAAGRKRLAMPVAGDDEGAKRLASRLVSDAGFDPVDTGGLRDGGRLQEPGGLLYDAAWTGPELERRVAEGAGRRRGLITRIRTIVRGFRNARSTDRR